MMTTSPSSVTLRGYQSDAVRALWRFWKETPGGAPLIVAPTGSGKSIIIADIVRRICVARPEYRVLIATHRQEIIQQNAAEFRGLLPGEPIGIFSAAMGEKRLARVTFAAVQSIYKKEIPKTQLLIIDECHLLSKNQQSMYGTMIAGLRKNNPDLKILGLTATPYRMDQGHLVSEGGIFTDIAYEIELHALLKDNYLAPLASLPSKERLDLSGVRRAGYDYNQADVEAIMDPLVDVHADEVIRLGAEKKHWLVFCSGVEHTKRFCDALNRKGVKATYITGEFTTIERESRLHAFRSGAVRALVNCDVLTTGFNFKPIDLIVLLRATKSTALYIQMLGRGMRTAEGKKNCMVLDFGLNIERHGPIDCVRIKKQGGKAEASKLPTKTCRECGCVVKISARICPNCEAEFPVAVPVLETAASTAPIMSAIEDLEVTNMEVKVHRKPGSPPMLRLNFYCGLRCVSEFFCFEHTGYAATVAAKKWVQYGAAAPAPVTTEEAYNRMGELPYWNQIRVKKDGKFDRIIGTAGRREQSNADELFEKYGVNI